jgi:hypothetical protein
VSTSTCDSLQLGDTFRWKDVRSIERHLYIVIVARPDGRIIAFNTSTHCDDRTCVLPPRAHPFIPKESVIFYAHGIVWSPDDVQRHLPDLELGPRIDLAIVERVQRGALESPQTPPGLRTLIVQALGLNPPVVIVRKRPKRPKSPDF